MAPLGAGGMGEVYRARDTRLERSVAIKVLSAEFADDASLKLRFEREARTISALSHPHICSLFDIGNHDGTDFLVMELLEGQTLADRLSSGPIPIADVLRLGGQIAEALAAAHRAGIVHRDLKPGNIMLTRSGAKLLDFGLAKSGGQLASHDATSAGTEQQPITERGAIMGTFQYMAPEQLEGSPADARTDIFALGAVLYEMATGVRAFTGKNRTSLIAAIVSGQPRAISELQPLTPQAFEQLVRACLEKDPDDRFQSARDVAMQLRWMAAGDASTRPQSGSKRERTGWITAAVLTTMLAAGAAYHIRTQPPSRAPLRFTITAPPGTNFARTAAISPDGRRLAFRADALDKPPMLYLRSLDSLVTQPIGGTESSSTVFWSPDGRHLGFIARGALKRLDTADGSVRTLLTGLSNLNGGATWNRAGVIVFSLVTEAPLYRISAEGGQHVPVTRFAKGDRVHCWPWFLPDGRHFLYTVLGVSGSSGIYAGALDSDLRKLIVPIGPLPDMTRAVYARGQLFYLRGRSLVAQEFDPKHLQLPGTALIIDDDIEITGPLRTPLSVSEDGTLVYRKAGSVAIDHLSMVDHSGREIAPVGKPGPHNSLRVSPDGTRILRAYDDPIASVWVYDSDRDTETRMTFERWAGLAAWVDNDSFVYSAVTDTPPNLFLKRPQGPPVRLTNSSAQHYIESVSPDGRFAIYTTEEARTGLDVYAVSLTPPHKPMPLLNSAAGEGSAHVSPDGRWLAYTSNESGTFQLYVTSFPQTGRKWQISPGRAEQPRWSRDGRELYYRDPATGMLMAVKIDAVREFRPGRPQPLFAIPSSLYDVASNGRFLIARPELNPDSPPLTVVVK